jgi:hypothetical protein
MANDSAQSEAVTLAVLMEQMKNINQSVQDHRTEHRNDNLAIKDLITTSMDKLDAKLEKVKEDHGTAITKHDGEIKVLKRDHNWMKGIFTAGWAGVIAWFEYRK